MSMNTSATTTTPHPLQPLFIREVVIKAIRAYFDEKNFHEVITPILNTSLPLEPNLYSFATTWNYLDLTESYYLPTSPESALKKLLAQGIGNCYAIGKSFRNNEAAGTQHNPEFLMLEWYRENATYQNIMDDVQALLHFVGQKIAAFDPTTQQRVAAFLEPWQTLSLPTLFEKHVGVTLAAVLEDAQLQQLAKTKGYQTNGATWSELFDQLFLNEIEPHLPKTPFFLTDFPARTSPLCKQKPDAPWLADRFEVYLGGMELGNGNTENTDATHVFKVFEAEQAFRSAHNLPSHPIDPEFLDALQTLANSNKSYAGIGLGVERLAMYCAGVSELQTVEPFAL